MNQAATALARTDQPELTPFQVIERVITQGDLSKMSPAERVAFYWRTCESLGLNALTRPFEFIVLNGKMVMYARKDATDQLRKLNGVSVTDVRRERDDELGLLTVYARGRDKSGREDEATGVVFVKGLAGEALANAAMKAETKAKRRLTLSLVGLGFLDESEVDGTADVDPMTGEIVAKATPVSLLESVNRQRARMAEATPAENAPGAEADPVAPTGTTEEAAAAAAPDAGADEPAWTQGQPDPAIELLDRLRTNAEASSLVGAMTEAQQRGLVPIFAPLKGVVGPGIRIAFGDDAVTTLTAAQAQAIANVSDSMGADAFAAAWRALVDAGASA